MIHNELKSKLEVEYELLAFYDLADITNNPGDLSIILKSIFKKEFASNQRIVFYSSHTPSQKLLAHIHRALWLMDIGSFFCLLCTSVDIKPQVKQFPDPISVMQIELTGTKNLNDGYHLPDNLCVLPWLHLELRHNGDICPCCVSTDIVGDARTDNIHDTMLNDQMSQLRKDFLNGQRPSGCQQCWRIEDQGQQSNRQFHNSLLMKKFQEEFVNDIQVRSLDIKPGNVCNFKCRICNPVSSSLFADEFNRHNKNKTFRIERWDEYNDYVWDQLKILLPTIENLDFYGGEPFLVKKIIVLLEEAINKDYAKKIRVHFNSNGSVYPEELIKLLGNFKHVDIAFSIDNVGKRFDLERGGSWDQVEANIIKFTELESDKIHIHLWVTVNIQNIYYLDDVFAWAEKYNIVLDLNFLDNPKWANINSMTPAAVKLVVDKYKDSNRPKLRALANWVSGAAGSNGNDFVNAMKKFDSIRNENFMDTHTEIARAMGY